MFASKYLKVFVFIKLLTWTSLCFSNPFSLSWPTPNPSFAKGLGYSTFLQKTGPDKDFSSGAFGCVRNHGYKFHEGLDLFPVQTTAKGYAVDSIFAAMAGEIAYISRAPKDSAYGRYMVIEHKTFTPVLYSLYAHMAEIPPKLSTGMNVSVAQPIGRMGNSASFHIPLNRSHLHFEIGVRLSDQFDKWYLRQSFKSKNKHGNYNGYNLVGIDPIKFYSSYQSGAFDEPAKYFKSLSPVTKILVKHQTLPDLAQSNPGLFSNLGLGKSTKSWICSFGPYGFPLGFEATTIETNEPIKVVSYDESLDSGFCRKLITSRNGTLYPSDQLLTYLELIFLD